MTTHFIDLGDLQARAKQIGVTLDDTALERFDLYAKALVEWNEKINLTAITQPEEIVTKHFVDSLTVLPVLQGENAKTLLDVGTGAGFPGLALLIAQPDLQVTLLDSTKKKLTVIDDILQRLSLSATLLHSRAEDAAHNAAFRERFDIVTSRAVAPMVLLAEYCLPFVRPGGTLIAMKSGAVAQELDDAREAVQILGGAQPAIQKMQLDAVGERSLVLIQKRSATNQKYPRPSAKIAKEPLTKKKTPSKSRKS